MPTMVLLLSVAGGRKKARSHQLLGASQPAESPLLSETPGAKSWQTRRLTQVYAPKLPEADHGPDQKYTDSKR